MEKQNGSKIIIAVLSAAVAVLLCVAGWALFLRPTPKLTDYEPSELEPNALSYESGAEGSKASAGSGGFASIEYTKDVRVNRKTGTAQLYYANPSNSVNSVAIQLILVDGEGREAILGQSGLLMPGTKLEELQLDDVGCRPGLYSGKYILTFYDPETSDKAILNTVIDGLNVTVQ